MDDKYVIEKFWPNKISIFKRKLKGNLVTNEELIYLNNRFKDSSSIEETLFRIKHKIENKPKCEHCNSLLNFAGNKIGYYKYCSRKCLANSNEVREKFKNTCLYKYGVISPILQEYAIEKCKQNKNTPEAKEKIKQTCLKKYGVNSAWLREDIFSKAQQNSHSKEAREKAKQTICNKYGVTGWTQFKYVQDAAHSKETREKCKQTMLERYGYENNLQNEYIRQKGIEISHNIESNEKRKNTNINHFGKDNYGNRQKTKETWLKKYGVEHPRMLKESKEHMSKIMSSLEIQNKRYETLKKNKSFNTSKPENDIEIMLKEKFGDTIRHYSSKLYPFECDFYIPSLNLYIELHFHWTHGGHSFDENNENDKLQLEKWKSKESQFYKNAINTWTIRDVNKREIAKKNNLNWLCFYNKKEFEEWFEQQ